MSACKKLGIEYLTKKAESDRAAARLSLELLTKDPVGIGDHSTGDFYAGLDEALALLVDAEDRLEVLERHYGEKT